MSPTHRILFALVVFVFLFAACSNADDEVALTGELAFDYIRKDLSTAPETDLEAVDSIMDWAIEDYSEEQARLRGEPLSKSTDSSRVEAPENVVELLKKTAKAKKNLEPDSFERLDFSSFSVPEDASRKSALYSIDVSSLPDEFHVDNLEAIPVRNQGYRGTCAAFTGVGHLEYAALQKYDTLPTMDLSEQQYYYLSKPECWDSGCTLDEEGSWYSIAMESSKKASGPDIALETDCPYHSSPGKTDLQTPLLDSCDTGALQVKQIEYVREPEAIVKKLMETGLPIPFASPLSANWERNNGLITKAASNYSGDTSHAGGHAYLIVGFKKLPDMPEEGGLCFIIKNSWGTGWGVNGYSCMTLAWVESWTFGYYLDHPVAMDVLLREDLREAEELPNNEEAEDQSAPDVIDESDESTGENTDEPTDDEIETEIEVLPEPHDDKDLNWSSVKLFGPGESYFRAELAEEGEYVYVRGIVRETDARTGSIRLTADTEKSGRLIWDNDYVGSYGGGEIRLCSGEYDFICSLRLDTENNRMYIEFPYPDIRRVSENELGEGEWAGFDIPFGDYGVEVWAPDSLSALFEQKGYFRLTKSGGRPTDPVRLSLSGLDIRVMGETVGSLDPSDLGLCTGKYKKNCGMFTKGDELNVLPKW